MPVTVASGLVGVVTNVSERTAWVRTILDPLLSVGVSVRGRGGQGIAVGEAGGVVRVSGYTEEAPVRVGDTVETSSRGGLFPRGITVGHVVRVLPKDANALRREFLVRPSAALDNLLEVALIRPAVIAVTGARVCSYSAVVRTICAFPTAAFVRLCCR